MKKLFFLLLSVLLLSPFLLISIGEKGNPPLPASFVRDTAVHTPSGTVRIEDLHAGDSIITYDFENELWTQGTIEEISSFFYDIIAITTITLDDETISCTGHHPLYVMEGEGVKDRLLEDYPHTGNSMGWVQAGDLQVGDRLLSVQGEEATVTAVSTVEHSSLLFDLRVEGTHSFSVGDGGLVAGDITLVPQALFQVSYGGYDDYYYDDWEGSGGFCFPAGTTVVTTNGSIPIEEVEAGDSVISYNPHEDLWELGEVRRTFDHLYDGEMVQLTLGEEILEATVNHPFFVLSGRRLNRRKIPMDIPGEDREAYPQGRWVEAGDLRTGDLLQTMDGGLILNKISHFQSRQRVYNFEVVQNHSYAVGHPGIAVHNKGSMEMPSEMAMEDSMDIPMEMAAEEEYMESDRRSSQELPPDDSQEQQLSTTDVMPDKLYLSADDSNSCASPVIVRNIIDNGRYVHPSLIRTYEFYNYYSFGYLPPEEGQLGVYANMHDMGNDVYSIQAVLRSPDRTLDDLPPLNVVFLMDASGSMAGESWDISKEFVARYIDFLRPGDSFALVTVNRYARTLVDQYQVNQGASDYVRSILDGVIPDDITNLDPGIAKAYSIAGDFHRRPGLTRVIFISDGGANAGDFSGETISRYASDGEGQGIYLTGVGVGSGFNDGLMDKLTDTGRGAYFFLDSPGEIDHILSEFMSYFDLAYKDVRLAMQMPPGWSVKAFHGEQISTVREDIVPQYLAPNDQMIFHMELQYGGSSMNPQDIFTFEAEYTPIGDEPKLEVVSFSIEEMETPSQQLRKADVITAFAEGLKLISFPLEDHRQANLQIWDGVIQTMEHIRQELNDGELEEITGLAVGYGKILDEGEQFPQSADLNRWDIPATLGIPQETILSVETHGPAVQEAIVSIERLGTSVRLQPTEGYRFLGLSSGPVGNLYPVGSGSFSYSSMDHPEMEYMGLARYYMTLSAVFDRHTIVLRLKAPQNTRSFSFDLNYFSAEYPHYVNQNFNDSFYAILEASSTNQGAPTNISFDPDQNPLEVDNNYFQRRFHPIPNDGTGFDQNGSTGWLRTSWPIQGGEEFTLTFTIHDEGDSIFDSMALLDNFQWHDYPVLGNTDPLN